MQLSLLGHAPPAFDPEFRTLVRRELTEGAWFEHAPGWLAGHARLFDALERGVRWRQTTQTIYDKEVVTPRLIAGFDDLKDPPAVLEEMAAALSAHSGATYDRITFAYYRDGNDSVAWHRDRILRLKHDGLVATVSVGEPRTFALRPHQKPGASIRFQLGWGDLMIMGGTCQRTWEHTVPKLARVKGPRISIMFRCSDRDAPPGDEGM